MLPLARTAVVNTHREIAGSQGYLFDSSNPVLGHGRQGWVYRAFLASRLRARLLKQSLEHPDQDSLRDKIDLGMPVALKFYDEEASNDEAYYKRIRREKLITQRFPHPGIVKSYELSETKTSGHRYLFLVMELVEGDHLVDWMKATWQESSNEKDVRRIVWGICESLAHLHQNNVCHRDLKPHNIMIRADGSVCVMDLGLAMHNEPMAPATPSRTVVGSYPYSSPQAMRGMLPYEVTDDLYSLGAVLFEMIHFPERIFERYRTARGRDRCVHDLMRAVAEEDPFRLPSGRRPDWAKGFWIDLARQLLKKERDERPESVARILECLQSP